MKKSGEINDGSKGENGRKLQMGRFKFAANFKPSISLEYFKKSNRYFAGMTHSRESNETLPNTNDLFVGLSHFITKELTINGKLNYRKGKGDRYDLDNLRSEALSFSFGLDFWIL